MNYRRYFHPRIHICIILDICVHRSLIYVSHVLFNGGGIILRHTPPLLCILLFYLSSLALGVQRNPFPCPPPINLGNWKHRGVRLVHPQGK